MKWFKSKKDLVIEKLKDEYNNGAKILELTEEEWDIYEDSLPESVKDRFALQGYFVLSKGRAVSPTINVRNPELTGEERICLTFRGMPVIRRDNE